MLEQLEYYWLKLYTLSGIDNFTWEHAFFHIGLVFGVLIAELLYVGYPNSSIYKLIKFDKSVRTDLTFWLIDVFNLYTILAFILSLGICYFAVGLIDKNIEHFNLLGEMDNIYLQFLLIFLFSDLKNYVNHRIFHRSKTLWEVHSFHHSATSFNILTSYRGHFLEMSITKFADIIPFILLGAPIQTFFTVKILQKIHGLIKHSNLTHSWGIIGKYILVSPAAHKIHHSILQKHHDKNFSSTFIFWDRIFGTYHAPEPVHQMGIPDNPFNKRNVFSDILLPIKNFGKSVFRLNN